MTHRNSSPEYIPTEVNVYVHQKTPTKMLIAALFITAKTKSTQMSVDRRMNKSVIVSSTDSIEKN